MGCALDDVYPDVLYSIRRCNSSRMDFVMSGMRCQLQQFNRLFIQRDTGCDSIRVNQSEHKCTFARIIFILYPFSRSFKVTINEINVKHIFGKC